MKKVKVYEVTAPVLNLKESPVYYVDAPNKHIARWCGANLFNNEYMGFLTAKDMKAKRFRYKEKN